jgi:hypothetical protein
VPGGLAMKVMTGDSAARVRKFLSLGESSPELCGPSPRQRVDTEAATTS